MAKGRQQDPHGGEFGADIDSSIRLLEGFEQSRPAFLASSMGFLVTMTAARLKIEMLRRFKRQGYEVTPEQWLVLRTLIPDVKRSQRELAELTMKDRPAITRILDALEEKGFIARENDERDRRVTNIVLTPRGKKKIDTFAAIVADIDRRAFRGLAPVEIETLKDYLERIRRNLTT